MMPAQLAREKGHRFLAHYLDEFSSRHNGSKQCAPRPLIDVAFDESAFQESAACTLIVLVT